jgi:MoaA/NifB/PqqE/SkfB family radical SAM enzyme
MLQYFCMKKILNTFNFYEHNFKKESTKLLNFISSCQKNRTKLNHSKLFPPCIFKNKLLEKEYLLLSNKNVLTSNNLYFGQIYQITNKLVKSPRFVAEQCQDCRFFSNDLCRGLFNNDFLKIKEKLIKKFSSKIYHSLKSDFENGNITVGSLCKNKCFFCFSKTTPDNVLPYIPILKPEEIKHFLSYLAFPVATISVPFYSKPGEFFDHPKALEILNIIAPFCDKNTILFTNGNGLTDSKVLNILKKTNISICLSLHSIDANFRQKIMGSSKKIKIKELISLLIKNKINFEPLVIPLKKALRSGDLLRTMKYLVKNNISCTYFTKGSTTKWSLPAFKKDILKLDLVADYLQKNKINKNFYKIDNDYDKNMIEYICSTISNIQQRSKSNILLLVPKNNTKYFKDLSNRNIKIKSVSSAYKFSDPVAGVLTIHDYIKVLQTPANFKTIIIPRASFNMNYEDIYLNNINAFSPYLKNKNLIIF